MQSFRVKENVLSFTAKASLIYVNEEVSDISIEVEKDRLEKIATFFYNTDKSDIEYNEFVARWVEDNMEDLVYTDKYDHIAFK